MANFIYATAPSGRVVKIPLTGGALDRVEIGERIISSGVALNELPDVGFSLTPPSRPMAFTVEERAEISAVTDALPPFPPPNQDNMLPAFSSIEIGKCVGLDEVKKSGGKYFMQRPGAEWIDILSLPEGDFFDPKDYAMMHSGKVALCYGKVWRLADQQNIPPAVESYERTSVFRSGITEKTTLEIEATLGYEGYGASVSLRVLFRREFTINTEQEQIEVFRLYGEPGILKVFGLWQECDIMMVQIDGKRMDDPVFSLTLKDKHGTPYTVVDRFDGILNPLSRDQAQFLSVPIS